MKEQNEENKNSLTEVLSKSELFLEKNKKIITIVVVAILVVVLGFFGLKKFYFQPREVEASEEMFYAENLWAADQFEQALNGDENHLGFVDIIDQYSCTKAGNLAKYYAGVSELRLGHFEQAISYLEKYKGKDTFTKVFSVILTGDAELELGHNDAALKNYMKAANMDKDNYVTAPMALYKAGMVHLINGNNAEATKCFEQVKKDYPESSERAEIDKYIGYSEAAEQK